MQRLSVFMAALVLVGAGCAPIATPEESPEGDAMMEESMMEEKEGEEGDLMMQGLEVDEEKEAAEEKVVEEKEPEPTPAPAPKPVSVSPGIALKASTGEKGVDLSWSMVGGATAPNGFKVVKSKDAYPTYPEDHPKYLNDQYRSYTYSVKDGNTYYFRVCAWDGHKGCLMYSNNVAGTAPEYKKEEKHTKKDNGYTPISGELQISATNTEKGVEINWTQCTSGDFKYYKLVRSESDADPYYPKSSTLYYSENKHTLGYTDKTAKDGKSYYYRVCSVENSGEVYCGNVAKITH